VQAQELHAAEMAFAALDEVSLLELLLLLHTVSACFHPACSADTSAVVRVQVDKVEFIQSVMEIPSLEGRNAEVLLYMRRPEDAEAVLLQGGLVYRAIMLNVRLSRWTRWVIVLLARAVWCGLVSCHVYVVRHATL